VASLKRVLFVQHAVDPNMLPVLARLSAMPDIAVEVLFASRLPPHRQWSGAVGGGIRSGFLPRLEINLGRLGAPFVLRINPTAALEIWRRRPDAVVSTPFPSATSLTALAMARLMGRPFILDIYTMASQSSARRVFEPLLRWLVRRCDAFVAKSSRTAGYLVSLGAPPTRVFLAHHAVDAQGLRERARLTPSEKAELRSRHGIRDGQVLLYVGRLVERKGLKVLLEAFAGLKEALPNTSLLLVGDGYQRPELEGLCRQKALSDVHFIGSVPHLELPRYYGLADLLVLPSISTRVRFWGEEAWGFVVGEALACGVPAVVTDRVGCADDLIRDGENGYVVKEKDAGGLRAAMLQVLSDHELHARLRRGAERHIADFSYERAAAGYHAAIEHVLGGAPTATERSGTRKRLRY